MMGGLIMASDSEPVSLVTGGSGFIGQHLVRLLLRGGHHVRIFDLREPAARDIVAAGAVEFHPGNIADRPALSRAMQGAKWVSHVAAIPSLWMPSKKFFTEVNHHGTLNVLAEAENHRPERIVYTSTESILAGTRRKAAAGRVVDETIQSTVRDMPGDYCRSKFLAERAALDAAGRGLPVVVVNPTLPVGPGDEFLTPPARMLLDFITGRAPAFLEAEINMIDVRDVAIGHLLAAQRGGIGRRYILGGENIRMSHLLALLEQLSGCAMPRRRIPYWLAYAFAAADELVADRITKRPPRAPLAGVRLVRDPMRFDNRRALEELGLKPRPIRQAIADAIRWFHEQGLVELPLREQIAR